MKSTFDLALDYVFANEGGFANVQGDHGGATKFGITISTLSRWRHRRVGIQDVRDLSHGEAAKIYHDWYWMPQNLDNVISPSKAFCIFDIGIVRGITISSKYAQMACNKCNTAESVPLVVDGDLGPKSVGVINRVLDRPFILQFAALAETGFRSIVARNPSQKKFLKGWINRAERLKTLGLEKA